MCPINLSNIEWGIYKTGPENGKVYLLIEIVYPTCWQLYSFIFLGTLTLNLFFYYTAILLRPPVTSNFLLNLLV